MLNVILIRGSFGVECGKRQNKHSFRLSLNHVQPQRSLTKIACSMCFGTHDLCKTNTLASTKCLFAHLNAQNREVITLVDFIFLKKVGYVQLNSNPKTLLVIFQMDI